jgi:hypothetical protein
MDPKLTNGERWFVTYQDVSGGIRRASLVDSSAAIAIDPP